MRIIFLTSCFLLSACAWDTISKDWACPEVIYCDCNVEKEVIQNALNYINYLKKVGETSPKEIYKIPHPFAKESQKTINGKRVAKDSIEFVQQLVDLKKTCNPWKIEVLEILSSCGIKAATIQYRIQTSPLGTFIVIAIVHFSDNGKVKTVNEVYSRSEDLKK